MINYILGPAGSGKTEYIYREAEKNISDGIMTYILVPEQYSMLSERDMLKRLGFDAQGLVAVLTFSRLSNMILSSRGPLRMKYIDGAGRNMLAYRSIMLCEKKLEYFPHRSLNSGFSKSLTALFSEFKRYGITPETLEVSRKKIENPELSSKLSDIKILYAKYDELLNEKNSDAEDNLSLITPKIRECDFLRGKLYVNHFKSFTPVEYDALCELMKLSDLTFSFTLDSLTRSSSASAFKSIRHTQKKLDELSARLGISRGKDIFLTGSEKFNNCPELLFLRDNALSFSPNRYPDKPSGIRLLRPKSRYDEAVCAAKLICKMLRSDAYSSDDILILVSDMKNYADILPVVFEKYSLSCFIGEKKPLADNMFIKFMLTILEILAYGFSYERIMTCLRFGCFGIDRSEADMFENYLLAAAPPKSRLSSKKDFTRNPDTKRFNMEVINSVKRRSINSIIRLSEGISGRKTADEICENLFKWIISSGIKKRFEQRLTELSKNGGEEKFRELESVWSLFVALLSQTKEMFNGVYMTYTAFYGIFASAVSDITLSAPPVLLNQITVCETENFKSQNAKAVIVLGVSEDDFPKSFSEGGTLSDAERTELSELGLTLAPTAAEKISDEQYLIYSVLSAPSEKLFLMSPIADNEGKPLQKSELFGIIKNIFPKIVEELPEATPSYDPEYFLEGQSAAFDALEETLYSVGSADKLPEFWRNIYNFFEQAPEYQKRLDNIKNISLSSENLERLSLQAAERLYGKPLMLSVSKLEKYNACAFSYFLTYGLFADERKTASVLSSDVGSVIHEVLCTYFNAKKQENADYSKLRYASVRSEIEKIVESSKACTSNPLYGNSAYYKYTMLRIKDIAAASAWKIVRFYAQSSFRPYGFEVRIGDGGTFPPFVLTLENSEARINGSIDRIDISEIDGKNYFSIVDYKSSEKKIEPTLAKCGVRFQPLIYAEIAKDNIENSAPAAMLYMKTHDPIANISAVEKDGDPDKQHMEKLTVDGVVLGDDEVIAELDAEHNDKNAIHYIPTVKSSAVSSAEMAMLLKNAIETAKVSAQKISDGEIDINPVCIKGKFDACEYCKFSDICGMSE